MQTFQQYYNKKVISYFDLGNNQVEVNMSRAPKIVRIYVNDKLVLKTWVFRKSSYHRFKIDGKPAEIIIDIVKGSSGPIFVTFNVDGQNIDIDRWETSRRYTGSQSLIKESPIKLFLAVFLGTMVSLGLIDFIRGFIDGFMGVS
jgi:hypothetical protein